uniref:Holin n=1 Tax=Pseudomonas phage Touem01 TaxID=3138548 RepID=A0AAU6W1H4_9VIRU
MKSLKSLFLKAWHFIGDDRFSLLVAGAVYSLSLRQIGDGDYWGFAFLALSILSGVFAWRDLGRKVRA